MYFNLSNAARPVTLNVSTSASNIVTAWRATGNRSIQIKAVNLDSSATTNDEINWTAVTVDLIYQGNTHWTYNWTDTSTAGVYNITEAFVNDSAGSQNRTSWAQAAWFNVTGAAASAPCTPSTGGAWFNSSWDKRKSICINESQIVASHLNFPVLINITDLNLTTHAQADGDDILFANDSVQFPHEIEYFNSTDGRLVAWVNIPNLTGGFNFSMYYNNSAASNSQNKVGTWNNDYVAVWHLNGSSVDTKDSTRSGVNGTNNGASAVTALFGGGADFNSVNINFSDPTILDNAADLTFEFWANPDTLGVSRRFITKWVATNDYVISADDAASDEIIYAASTSAGVDVYVTTDANLAADTWYHIVATRSSAPAGTLYVNGVAKSLSHTVSNAGNIVGTTQELFMAGTVGGFFDGMLDEVRISNVTRNAQW